MWQAAFDPALNWKPRAAANRFMHMLVSGFVLPGCLVGCLAGCLAPTQEVQLSESSRFSTPAEYAARREIDLLPSERAMLEYDVALQSFELYAPAAIEDQAEAVGLVWVSPGRSGAPPRDWAAVLDRHGVYWLGANAAGNSRPPPDRINLALDAAQYLRETLGWQGSRVYVGGFSGGARIASEAALLYPDVFSGGVFMGATDYFRFVRSSDPRWPTWPPSFPPPVPKHLDLARSRTRFVFLTGSRDTNRSVVRDTYEAFVVDGFEGATLLEVAGLKHALPPAECFERALEALLSRESPGPQQLVRDCS